MSEYRYHDEDDERDIDEIRMDMYSGADDEELNLRDMYPGIDDEEWAMINMYDSGIDDDEFIDVNYAKSDEIFGAFGFTDDDDEYDDDEYDEFDDEEEFDDGDESQRFNAASPLRFNPDGRPYGPEDELKAMKEYMKGYDASPSYTPRDEMEGMKRHMEGYNPWDNEKDPEEKMMDELYDDPEFKEWTEKRNEEFYPSDERDYDREDPREVRERKLHEMENDPFYQEVGGLTDHEMEELGYRMKPDGSGYVHKEDYDTEYYSGDYENPGEDPYYGMTDEEKDMGYTASEKAFDRELYQDRREALRDDFNKRNDYRNEFESFDFGRDVKNTENNKDLSYSIGEAIKDSDKDFEEILSDTFEEISEKEEKDVKTAFSYKNDSRNYIDVPQTEDDNGYDYDA